MTDDTNPEIDQETAARLATIVGPAPEGCRWTFGVHTVPGWFWSTLLDQSDRPLIGARTLIREDGTVLTLSSNPGIHGFDHTEAVLAEWGDGPFDTNEIIADITRRTPDRNPR